MMKKTLVTLLLLVIALLSVGAAVLLYVDGSLARLTGRYHFRPGMSLFPPENLKHLTDVEWMRISDLHDTIESEREADGSWWIVSPFRDRMSPEAVQAILQFTATARLVDTLPLNHTTRTSMREFGVETSPHTITLKMPTGDTEHTTLARYTLGSASPWLADAGDGESLLPTTYLRTNFYGRDKRIHVVSGNILAIFKNGLQGLRDAHPVHIDPENVLEICVEHTAAPDATAPSPLKLTRDSAQSPWVICSPTLTEANQDKVENMLAAFSRLRAIRIEDEEEVELTGQPVMKIRFTHEDGRTEQLSVYAPFASPSDGQMLCYATTEGRPVVFTLAAEPRVRRRGGYANIVNGIYTLPILPPNVQVQVRNNLQLVYWADIPLTLAELRSPHFADITAKDVDRVVVRSRFYPYPLRLRLIPGDSEGQVSDVWMYSAEGQPFAEADPDVVTTFLNSLRNVPVEEFVRDIPPEEKSQKIEAEYGLGSPDYLMMVQPRECTVRATLFGEDLPLVRDRSARVFRMKRQRADGGRVFWVGMEQNSHSVCRLSSAMMKLFSFSAENWRKRNLTQFPISALRTMTLHYLREPLVLHYDYIGEAWTGTLGKEDVTPRINPHRTDYYVHHLQNIRVRQWLSKTDEDALQALQRPVFSVVLNLEITDYSDLEEIVIRDAGEGDQESVRPKGNTTGTEYAKEMLTEKTETDREFRKLATGRHKVEKKTITIEIAPIDPTDKQTSFYGRIREDGSLFMLDFEDAQGLDGQLLD